MGAITERPKMAAGNGGGKARIAPVKIVRDGRIVHSESRNVVRKRAAAAWLEECPRTCPRPSRMSETER